MDLRKFGQKKSYVVQPLGTCVFFYFPLDLSKKNRTIFRCVYYVIQMLHSFIPFIFLNSGCKGTPFCTGRQAWSISQGHWCMLSYSCIATLPTYFITKQVNAMLFADIANQVFSSTNWSFWARLVTSYHFHISYTAVQAKCAIYQFLSVASEGCNSPHPC